MIRLGYFDGVIAIRPGGHATPRGRSLAVWADRAGVWVVPVPSPVTARRLDPVPDPTLAALVAAAEAGECPVQPILDRLIEMSDLSLVPSSWLVLTPD